MTFKEKVRYWTDYCNQQKDEALEDEEYDSANVWDAIPFFLDESPMREIVEKKTNEELEDIIDDLFSYGLSEGEPLFQAWHGMFIDDWYEWCNE